VNFVLPDIGLADQLDYMLRAAIVGVLPWELALFTNNPTFSQATVWADMTEATFTGYSRVTLTRATWTAATIISGRAVSTWDTVPVQWTCTGSPQTIYGAAILEPVSNKVRKAEKFASPVVQAVGGILQFLPRWTYTTEPNP